MPSAKIAEIIAKVTKKSPYGKVFADSSFLLIFGIDECFGFFMHILYVYIFG